MLLAQHSFAVAAEHFWRRSGFHRTSHSDGAFRDNLKPNFSLRTGSRIKSRTRPKPLSQYWRVLLVFRIERSAMVL
jgi:hypothetical protein